MKKKYIIPLTILLASSALFAQEITYDYVISSDTSEAKLQGNTIVETGATLTLTGNNSTNYNLKIEEGAFLDFTANDAFKWGCGAGPKTNTIENYGTIYVLSGKEFRFGDDGSGFSTTLNLYDGSLLTTKEGNFILTNYRGKSSIINVYTGAVISNLERITSFDRGNESSENPLFELNVAGGTVSVNTINFGSWSNANSNTQTSIINVTNGGSFTSASNVILGNNAYNDAQINVSGENSKWTANGTVYVANNAASTGSLSVADNGVIETNGTLSLSNGGVTVNNGGTFNANGAVWAINGGITVNNGGVFNTGSSVEVQNSNVLVNSGAEYNVVSASSLSVGNKADQTATFTVDGGSLNMNATNADLNLFIGNNSSATGSLIITNDGIFKQGSGAKNTQVYLNSGNGTLEISNGGKWFANTNFYIGNQNGANSTLILNNGKIANSAGTGYSSDLNVASGAGATGSVIVSNGGQALFRSLRMAQGGANSKATLIVKDAGSLVRAMNTNDSNYRFILGINVSDSAKYTGNSATIEIHTGAQFANASIGTSLINDSAQMTFVINSDNIANASTAMFSTGKLAVYKTDDTVSSPFVIDGSELSAASLSEGDVVEFVIMTVSSDATFNDDILDLSNSEALAEIFEFKNNTGLTDWEDFGIDNLSLDGSNLVLSLTYVPEPSTYAAIFGALALAFVAYKRRK